MASRPLITYRLSVVGQTFSATEDFGEDLFAAIRARNKVSARISARVECSHDGGKTWRPTLVTPAMKEAA